MQSTIHLVSLDRAVLLLQSKQTNLNIHGSGFSVTDVDAATGTMTATLTVGEGDIALFAGDSGVTITANNSSTVSFTGTLAQIDAMLTGSGTGTILYNNGSDTPSASTTITVTVNDGGNTGADPGLTGDASSEQDSASQTINITATNDTPVTSVTPFNPTFSENGGPVGLFHSSSVDLVESGDLVSQIVLTVEDIVDGGSERLQIDGTQVELTDLNNESTLNNSYDVAVSVSGSTATLTITKAGGFSSSDAETLLNGTTFSITGDEIVNGTRDVTLVSLTDDGGGSSTESIGTVSTVTVVGSNDDPINSGSLPSNVTV